MASLGRARTTGKRKEGSSDPTRPYVNNQGSERSDETKFDRAAGDDDHLADLFAVEQRGDALVGPRQPLRVRRRRRRPAP